MAFAQSLSTAADAEPVLSVSQLSLFLKELVEAAFPSVWVAGEISNFSRPQSGHCYLTLKDQEAQIKAVIWRSAASRLRFDPHDGLEVICRGHIDLYPPRGQYQLVIEEIQPRGIGALELALRKLRDRLAAEGLFDPARKRPLPVFPRRIGFVTSPTGAAVRDFLQVLERRWRGASVLIIPAKVQGDGAAAEIAAGIASANRLTGTPLELDLLVVGRGGGSLEDLWAFNEEIVVRAIVGSRLPVVSAVGHEIDVTLSDLAADVRALTPSEAAERVVPAADEVQAALTVRQQRLQKALRRRAADARRRLEHVAGHRVFRRPFDRVLNHARDVDRLLGMMLRAARRRLLSTRQLLAAASARLEALSPLGILGRGYSLTTRLSDGRLIDDAAQLSAGDQIRTRFARGQATSQVLEISPDDATKSAQTPKKHSTHP